MRAASAETPRQLHTSLQKMRSAIQGSRWSTGGATGYRRVTAELERRWMVVNRKRAAWIMREDNLLAVQPKRFVTSTDPKHALEVYLNLARRMHLTAKDQLWIADIIGEPLR